MKDTCIKLIQNRGIPIKGNDIDTDRIIPARFMKCVTFDGLGEYAFYDVRYEADGSEKKHPFNEPVYKNAGILVVNKNFGCGSSREHAPQALQKYGIKALIGESFAEIFAGNCTAMGIPTVIISETDSVKLQKFIEMHPETEISIDLDNKQINYASNIISLSMPEAYRQSLVQGSWDSTAVLLSNSNQIAERFSSIPYCNNFA